MNLGQSIWIAKSTPPRRMSAIQLLVSSVAMLLGSCASMAPATETVTAKPKAKNMNELELAQQLAQSELRNTQKSIDLSAAYASTAGVQASLDSKDVQLHEIELQLKDLDAKMTSRGMVATVGDVLFESGQARLLADGSRNMVKLADFFKRNPERTASIDGFTDSVSSALENLDLSNRRVEIVFARRAENVLVK